MANFPVPVGGIVYPSDFGPSVVFIVLYVLLLPFVLYRMFNRRSRTLVLMGTAFGTAERIGAFTVRVIQSRSEKQRFSNGSVNYMQVTLSLGFLGILNDVVSILRCALVNPTYGSAMYYQSPAASNKEGFYSAPLAGTPDRPRLRAVCRNMMGMLQLFLLIGGTALGVYGNSRYSKIFDDQKKADLTATIRTVSTAVALAVSIAVIAITGWSVHVFRANSKRSAGIIAAATSLLFIVAAYRLAVIKDKTTSLEAPLSLNEGKAKAAFYMCHALPEWLSAAILFMDDVRKVFGTGLVGDTRLKDMTKEQHDRWVAKQAKKKEKKRARLGVPANSGPEPFVHFQQT